MSSSRAANAMLPGRRLGPAGHQGAGLLGSSRRREIRGQGIRVMRLEVGADGGPVPALDRLSEDAAGHAAGPRCEKAVAQRVAGEREWCRAAAAGTASRRSPPATTARHTANRSPWARRRGRAASGAGRPPTLRPGQPATAASMGAMSRPDSRHWSSSPSRRSRGSRTSNIGSVRSFRLSRAG